MSETKIVKLKIEDSIKMYERLKKELEATRKRFDFVDQERADTDAGLKQIDEKHQKNFRVLEKKYIKNQERIMKDHEFLRKHVSIVDMNQKNVDFYLM